MQIDLEKVTQALGLPKGTDEKVVNAKVIDFMLNAKKSNEQMEALSAALPAHGLKFEDGKVVRVAPSPADAPAAKPTETLSADAKILMGEVAELRTKLMSGDFNLAKAELEKLSAAGKIAPAHVEKLAKVFAFASKPKVDQLAADGTIVEAVMDLKAILLDVFNTLPAAVDLSGAKPVASAKDYEDRKARAREIAARVGKVKQAK